MLFFGIEHGGVDNFVRIFSLIHVLIRPNMSFDFRSFKHIVKGRCIAIKDVIFDIISFLIGNTLYFATFKCLF